MTSSIFQPTSVLFEKGVIRRVYERRLTDFAVSSEDSIVLAYGSFGLDVESKTVGVDAIITTDIRLAEHYERRHGEIKRRFDEMIVNLPETYAVLRLPQVLTTAAILARS